MKTQNRRTRTTQPLETQGIVTAPLATAVAFDTSAFGTVGSTEIIPATWEDRARKAWEYCIEEPLVKNCVNSWRTFAVGDEIKIASDDETVKNEANDLAQRLGISEFVKDMILQLLVEAEEYASAEACASGVLSAQKRLAP